MKPVLFVTGHAPAYRVGAFALLAEHERAEFALFGGRLQHGGEETTGELPFAQRPVHGDDMEGASELYAMASSGRYRAVVCSSGGRLALPATWAGARRARVPLLLWTSLWAHPRTVAHGFSFLALRRLYRSADALVTYGPHVSAYVRGYGARNVHEAPQAVDNEFWSSPDVRPVTHPGWPAGAAVKFLFAGRPEREKGRGVLFEAWSMSGLQAPTAALVLVGTGLTPPWVPAGGAVASAARKREAAAGGVDAVARQPAVVPGAAGGPDGDTAVASIDAVPATTLRDMYAAADVLVVPSIPTRTFREPWGLVVNEAMNRKLPVICSDAVGAAAGGLVRDGHNGIVVPAGEPVALAAALRRLVGDPAARARMGAEGKRDVAAYDFNAWAGGFSSALASLGLSRQPRACREGVR